MRTETFSLSCVLCSFAMIAACGGDAPGPMASYNTEMKELADLLASIQADIDSIDRFLDKDDFDSVEPLIARQLASIDQFNQGVERLRSAETSLGTAVPLGSKLPQAIIPAPYVAYMLTVAGVAYLGSKLRSHGDEAVKLQRERLAADTPEEEDRIKQALKAKAKEAALEIGVEVVSGFVPLGKADTVRKVVLQTVAKQVVSEVVVAAVSKECEEPQPSCRVSLTTTDTLGAAPVTEGRDLVMVVAKEGYQRQVYTELDTTVAQTTTVTIDDLLPIGAKPSASDSEEAWILCQGLGSDSKKHYACARYNGQLAYLNNLDSFEKDALCFEADYGGLYNTHGSESACRKECKSLAQIQGNLVCDTMP